MTEKITQFGQRYDTEEEFSRVVAQLVLALIKARGTAIQEKLSSQRDKSIQESVFGLCEKLYNRFTSVNVGVEVDSSNTNQVAMVDAGLFIGSLV